MARVLIVEDHLDAARMLQIVLESEGHEVQIADDGARALEAFDAFQPDFVFLDITLPGMDGYEVAVNLRSRASAKGLRIAALTGWDELDAGQLKGAGIDLYLVKPVGLATLREAMGSARQLA